MYLDGGIQLILSYQKHSGRPSEITSKEHQLIEEKLKNPINGLRGYVELLSWMELEFKRTFKYNTVLKYCNRHFNSKVKVARKSHIKKDEEAVTVLFHNI